MKPIIARYKWPLLVGFVLFALAANMLYPEDEHSPAATVVDVITEYSMYDAELGVTCRWRTNARGAAVSDVYCRPDETN